MFYRLNSVNFIFMMWFPNSIAVFLCTPSKRFICGDNCQPIGSYCVEEIFFSSFSTLLVPGIIAKEQEKVKTKFADDQFPSPLEAVFKPNTWKVWMGKAEMCALGFVTVFLVYFFFLYFLLYNFWFLWYCPTIYI